MLTKWVESDIHHAAGSDIHGHFESAGFEHIQRRKINLLLPLPVTTGDATEATG